MVEAEGQGERHLIHFLEACVRVQLLGDLLAAANQISSEHHAPQPLRSSGTGSAFIHIPLVLLPPGRSRRVRRDHHQALRDPRLIMPRGRSRFAELTDLRLLDQVKVRLLVLVGKITLLDSRLNPFEPDQTADFVLPPAR